MELHTFIVLFCTLFTGGHSLECYQCSGEMGSCESKRTCEGTDSCASTTTVQTSGGKEDKTQSKGCKVKESCISTSVNYGVIRTVTSTQCCTTDLCNSKDPPVYSSKPNGKQCYHCDGNSCFSKLNCLGDEDYCATATLGSLTLKGCASKSVCDSKSQDFSAVSCCKGNLCNSAKSVTQNLLFLLWPFIFYILIN